MKRKYKPPPGDPRLDPPVPAAEAEISDQRPIVYENFLEPLVPPDLWEAVQEELAGRRTLYLRRRVTFARYLLTGRLTCALCGLFWQGSKGQRPNGSNTPRYVHGRSREQEKTCAAGGRTVRADEIEPTVLEQLRLVLGDPGLEHRVRAELAWLGNTEAQERTRREAQELRATVGRREEELNLAIELSVRSGSETARMKYREKVEHLGRQIDAGRIDLRRLEGAELLLKQALSRKLGLVTRSSELIALVDEGFDRQRALIEEVVQSIRVDIIARKLEITLRVD